MVEPSFLVGIAVVFVVALAFILKQTTAAPETEKKKVERKVNKQPKKTKGPQRNSLKKDRRPPDVKEWVGVDNPQKDAQEMLEFLKGKDPAELAKQHNQGKGNTKKKQQQVKKPKVDESTSEDSASEGHLEDGFSKIVRKPKTEKKKDSNKKKKEKEEIRVPNPNKAFFKPPPGAEGEAKPIEKKPKRERRPQTDNADPSADGSAAPQERKRERRDRPDGEKRPEGERKDRPEGERKERRENPDRPQRKPLPTVAPIVKYEQADLTDILASITQDFDRQPKVPVKDRKSKPKGDPRDPRTSKKFIVFSKVPRNVVLQILEKVEVRDLVALSRVNHYFSGVARKESLWKDILLRDFGIDGAGTFKNCRLAYKAEFMRKKEEKSTQSPVETSQQDNKKKKAEEKPATDATAED